MAYLPRLALCRSLLVLLTLFAPVTAKADPLKEVMKSRDFRGPKNRNTTQRLVSEIWFAPGSTLWMLFNDPAISVQLPSWLEPRFNNYITSPVTPLSTIEFRGAQMPLTTPQIQRVLLQVLVPHPKYKVSAETGLVPAFGIWKFPTIQFVRKKDLSIPGAKSAALYELSDGACAVVIDADLAALITIQAQRCEKKAELEDTARRLDIEAFNKKLAS